MSQPILDEIKDPAVMAALTLGMNRAKLGAPPALAASLGAGGSGALERWPLAAAALLGQEACFRRPAVPPFRDATRLPAQDGPLFTEPERVALRRLVGRANDEPGLLTALWTYLRLTTRRFHPFDLAALAPLLKDPAAVLGPVESAWRTRVAGAHRAVDGPLEGLNESNWREATPAVQGDFARVRREADPTEGRRLVQEGLEGQPAATRCRLVETLEYGLSAEDRELLESLLVDRAKSVKEASAGLLSRLPGTAQYAERMEDALAQLDFGKKGKPGRKKALKLRRGGKLPAGVLHQAQATFQFVRAEDLASALELSIEEMFQAASEDALLQTVFLNRALLEGPDAIRRAAPLLRNADCWAALPFDRSSYVTAGMAEALALVLRPAGWSQWPSDYQLHHLQLIAAGPLPVGVAQELLDCPALRVALQGEIDSPSDGGSPFLSLVSLTPRSLHPLLQERLAALPFHRSSAVLELIRFVDSILAPASTTASSHD